MFFSVPVHLMNCPLDICKIGTCKDKGTVLKIRFVLNEIHWCAEIYESVYVI